MWYGLSADATRSGVPRWFGLARTGAVSVGWDHHDEHIRAVYPPPNRDVAVDGGNRICRTGGSAAFAGRAAAAGGLPDHIGECHTARRQRGDHGGIGGGPAGTSIRPDSGRHPTDLGERAQFDLDYDPVRPQPQHRFRRPGRSSGDHGGRQDAAAANVDPAELQEGQSGRFPNPDSVCAIRHPAAYHGR